jgi:gluconolactonase
LVRWSNGTAERFEVGGEPNGLAFNRDGEPVFCDAGSGSLRTLHRTLCAGFDRPNDLAFDPAGNLVFTCPGASRHDPSGYVCCLWSTGEVTRVAGDLFFPNGLAFAGDGRTLYIAETYRRRIWKGDWNPDTGEWSRAQPWADTGGPIGPDGLAVDTQGVVYAAVYGQGYVQMFEPSGALRGAIALDGRNPTNVAFDPSGKLGLVITEAERGEIISVPGLGPGVPLYS